MHRALRRDPSRGRTIRTRTCCSPFEHAPAGPFGLVQQPLQGPRLHDVAWRQILGIAVPPFGAYVCAGPEGKRARDLAPAARQAPEPARRTVGVNSFSEEASAPM